MRTLEIDIESFSSVNLQKCGLYKYAESPDFQILLFGYAVDNNPVQVVDLACGEQIPADILAAIEDDDILKWSHNSAFERVCISRHLGYPLGDYLSPSSWRCSMTWAAYLGLPLSLAGVGEILGLEKKKLSEGKELVKFFCQPCASTKANGGRIRNMPADAPDKWELFKSYNQRDVEVEMQIAQRLAKFPVPDSVWDEYHLSEEINDRGIGMDKPFVSACLSLDAKSRDDLTETMRELTTLENPNSVAQVKGWLADNGLEIDTLGKKEVSEQLKTASEELVPVLQLRQKLAKSSVRKYSAMENAVCSDKRIRGMFMFLGASRTGRFAGRLVQLQNLPQNHIPDLAEARALAGTGDYDALEMLYEDIPDTLSQLIRTAFVPQNGRKFIVADFSAIEARVISWFAKEQWKSDAFAKGEDIYCATASQMFRVPVVKHGVNGELRQKGKVAELACVAEGQLVLTDRGLVSIEQVTLNDRLWDGENWVRHDGVIYKGEREVIEYEGLIATPDHLVWVEGKQEPIQFGLAAASSSHLLQTGDGRHAIWLGKNNQPGEKMEQGNESLLCADPMHGMRQRPMAKPKQFTAWYIQRLSALLSATADTPTARQTFYSRQTTMRKSQRPKLPQLWRTWYKVRFFKCDRSRSVYDSKIRDSGSYNGNRQNRYKWGLFARKSALWDSSSKLHQSEEVCSVAVQSRILAICAISGCAETIAVPQPRKNHSRCCESGIRKAEELAHHQRTARLYDIRNAGRNHRFTVSGKLVHNCGYGGSAGALKAMGALDMGLKEHELQTIVNAWRSANPNIVKFWWAVDRAAKAAIKGKTQTTAYGVQFTCESGFLFIKLPSGRRLAYVKPRIGENRFGGEAITYEGAGGTKKWERLETYGPKLVENIVQATSRDILCHAMKTLRQCNIVAHVHDEIIIEADRTMSLETVCEQMGRIPPWAPGLILQADGYECDFYKKA